MQYKYIPATLVFLMVFSSFCLYSQDEGRFHNFVYSTKVLNLYLKKSEKLYRQSNKKLEFNLDSCLVSKEVHARVLKDSLTYVYIYNESYKQNKIDSLKYCSALNLLKSFLKEERCFLTNIDKFKKNNQANSNTLKRDQKKLLQKINNVNVYNSRLVSHLNKDIFKVFQRTDFQNFLNKNLALFQNNTDKLQGITKLQTNKLVEQTLASNMDRVKK